MVTYCVAAGRQTLSAALYSSHIRENIIRELLVLCDFGQLDTFSKHVILEHFFLLANQSHTAKYVYLLKLQKRDEKIYRNCLNSFTLLIHVWYLQQ